MMKILAFGAFAFILFQWGYGIGFNNAASDIKRGYEAQFKTLEIQCKTLCHQGLME